MSNDNDQPMDGYEAPAPEPEKGREETAVPEPETPQSETPKWYDDPGFRDALREAVGSEKPSVPWALPILMERFSETDANKLYGQFFEYVRSLDKDVPAEEIRKQFISALQQNVGTVWQGKEYASFFDRPDADLGQVVDVDQGKLHIRNPKVQIGGRELTGRNSVMALSSVFGLGKPATIDLMVSGLSLTVGNFRRSEYSNLQARLIRMNSETGTRIHGRLFSADDTRIVGTILDYVLDHVISTSVEEWSSGNKELLASLIKAPDIPNLLAGVLDSIYGNNYPMSRRCVNVLAGKCDYESKVTLAKNGVEFKADSIVTFRQLPWHDKSRLTAPMRRHLAAKSRTVAQIKEYQQNYEDTLMPNVVDVPCNNHTVRIALRIPTVEDLVTASRYWYAEVDRHVDSLLSDFVGSRNERVAQRTEYIQLYRNVMRAQREAAWVKSVAIIDNETDDTNVVEDLEDVFDNIALLSEDDTLYGAFLKGVVDYQENSIISFTGTLNYKCPKCGTEQSPDHKHGLIPVNIVGFFYMTAISEWAHSNMS